MSARQLTGAGATALAVLAAGLVASSLVMKRAEEPPPVRMAAVVDSGPAWRLATAGVVETAQRRGIELDVFTLGESASGGASPLVGQGFDASQYDALLLGVWRADELRGVLDGLSSRTRLVTFGVESAPEQRLCHVGTSDYTLGRRCGEAVLNLLPRGGPTVVILDESASPSVGDRLEGFEDRLRQAALARWADGRPLSWQIEARIDGKLAAAAERVAALARKSPELSCVVNLNDESSAPLAGQLVAQAPLNRLTWIVCDSSDAALETLASGRVHVSVAQDSYEIGCSAIDRAALLVRWNPIAQPLPGKGSVNVQPDVLRSPGAPAARAEALPARTESGG